MPLLFKDAGSAALDNPAALAQMQAIWQANVQQMAQYVKNRGWEVTDEPTSPLGLSAGQLDELQATVGEPLPAQLRWLLSWAGEWEFAWRCSEEDAPPGELSECSDGNLHWSAALLEEEDLRGQLSDWVEHHNELLEAYEEEAFFNAHTAFWQGHFPFARTPGGDLITIDTRNSDPQHQPVRYFFHDLDGDSTDGALLAPNLFSFISRLTALGCPGSEYWCGWRLFNRDDQHGFDLQGKNARKWLAWLIQDPNAIPAEERRPKRVPARSEADKTLLLSAKAGNLEGVRKALNQGAHPDAEDLQDLLNPNMFEGFSKGDTALVLAARQNRLDILEVLLDAGASLTTHDLPFALLMRTDEYGANTQTLYWLIARGARIDPWPNDDQRQIALHRLIGSGLSQEDYWMLLCAMLDAGCNPDVTLNDGTTALMRTGPKSQQRLLDVGANPHLRDHNGMTAMHHMHWPEQPALLTAHGLDINDLSQPEAPDQATLRPLHHILLRHWPDKPSKLAALVQAMLEQGADPALPDGQGYNAWRYCRHVQCAEVLQQHLPLAPNERDARGRTVLHQRVLHQYNLEPHDVAQMVWFMQHGVDVNAQDEQGNTALHELAARSAYHGPHYEPAHLQVLLDHGARWDISNHNGKTPMQLLKPNQRKRWTQ